MKSTKELLAEKRQGAEWPADVVQHFVDGVVSGGVSSAQAGAFLMAACIHDLTSAETAALTQAMANSGVRFDKGLTTRQRVDKHSTGGVGDKVSLLLAPLAASCGLAVPMISGRGLGHTGGTVDKLESIVGFRTDLAMDELQRILSQEHLVMAAQSPELAPADKILYGLRDVTGTVENVGLITASILSKKFAERLDGLVMDIKVGRGAFMRSIDEAERLAESIMNTCRAAGLPVTIVFTRMDKPLGRSVGNWVEVQEAEQALANIDLVESDLLAVTTVLTAHMILVGGLQPSYEDARDLVLTQWRTGAAWKQFHRMITAQGGSWQATLDRHQSANLQTSVASRAGFVADIEPMAAALAVMKAGGGRHTESDVIDPTAGVVLLVERGEKVVAGQPLATITARNSQRAEALLAAMADVIHITTAPAEQEPSILIDVWQ